MKAIIESFKPLAGWHCITNSIKQIFAFENVNISEEMLFGLGSGLNFFYFDFKFAPAPMIGGRTKLGELETNIADALNIKLDIMETASQAKGYTALVNRLAAGKPVMILVDMAYLDYLNLPEEYHFGGHSIIVFGIDEEQGLAYVSDRDGNNFKTSMNPNEKPKDFHFLSIDNLNAARNSKHKPFPPKNALFDFDLSDIVMPNKSIILEAIKKNAISIMNPPIKNLGLSGIKKFASELPKWAKFDEEKLKYAALNAYIFICAVGGNGGGCFRRMYGNFFLEAATNYNLPQFKSDAEECLSISEYWDKVGEQFFTIFNGADAGVLNVIQKELNDIYNLEINLWNSIAGKVL